MTGPDAADRGLPSVDEPAHQRFVGGRDLTRWPSRVGQLLVRMVVAVGVRDSHAALVLIALVGVAVITLLTKASAEVYEAVAQGGALAVVDQPVLDAALATRTPTGERLVTGFTHLGGTMGMPIIASCATLALVWARRTWTPLVVMAVATAGSLLITVAGKDLIGRARPPRSEAVPPFESSPSFPSGHTLNSTVIAGALAYLVLPLLRHLTSRIIAVLLALTWAVSMGLSRVWLGHHWLTDVVVGWTIGLAWLAVIITAHRIYLTVQHGSPRTPAADPTRRLLRRRSGPG